jgi:hypothetical protein
MTAAAGSGGSTAQKSRKSLPLSCLKPFYRKSDSSCNEASSFLVLFWLDAIAKETVRSASKIRPDQNTTRMGVHHDPDKYSLDGGVCDFCE